MDKSITFFDTEIDSIRSFDPDSQRSLETVDEIRVLPGREFPTDAQALVDFRAKWREFFTGDPSKAILYKDLTHGIINAGIEYYLPLFFEEMVGRHSDYSGRMPECRNPIRNLGRGLLSFPRRRKPHRLGSS